MRKIDSDPIFSTSLPGGHCKWVPPDPIPNSEVKLLSADDSVGSRHVKVGHCQALIQNPVSVRSGFFYVYGLVVWRIMSLTFDPISLKRKKTGLV